MLDRLSPRPGARHRKKRVGRGPGSGWNKTAGRGVKGQGKRSAGRETPAWFEGGQMPITRRLPKRGFRNIHARSVETLNLRDLVAFGEGATVDVAALVDRGLVRRRAAAVKLLGEGEALPRLTVHVHRVSASARRKIEDAGGKVELIA
jgi:large subunit ribosomal protein L15